ncbi:MAG: four helix bundle protein [Bacteroidetes bacterium]|nr:four helix bundle protein [Bacteroidota bacterium]
MYNQKEKTEKAGTFFRFEDLRIYHKSLDYIVWLQDVTMLFPNNDQSQFILRFCDSARNIAFFIAEGSARDKLQFIQYLKMAKSAIRECLVYTTLSLMQNNITDTQDQESRQQLMEMTKMIGALISSLQRSHSNSNNGGQSNGNGNYRYNGKGEEHVERISKYDNVDDIYKQDIED